MPDLTRQMIRGPHFVLSPEGRESVQAFLAAEEEAGEKYSAEWLGCFDRRDLKRSPGSAPRLFGLGDQTARVF